MTGEKGVKCEACEEAEEQDILVDAYRKAKPYHVCSNCLLALVMHRLTPKEFGNLIKNGHLNTEHYLHDDFYDEDGKALQPM